MAVKPSTGYILALVSFVIILVGVGVALYSAKTVSGEYIPTTFAETKAKTAAKSVACLAMADKSDLKIPSSEQTDIVNAVSISIIDVPAGTNFNVYISSYDGAKSAGSIMYDGGYENYNFTATRKSDPSAIFGTINWVVNTFVSCKK